MAKERIEHPGECPKCTGENLDYDAAEFQDDEIVTRVSCSDCGWSGLLWEKRQFVCYTDEEGESVDVYGENEDFERDDTE